MRLSFGTIHTIATFVALHHLYTKFYDKKNKFVIAEQESQPIKTLISNADTTVTFKRSRAIQT